MVETRILSDIIHEAPAACGCSRNGFGRRGQADDSTSAPEGRRWGLRRGPRVTTNTVYLRVNYEGTLVHPAEGEPAPREAGREGAEVFFGDAGIQGGVRSAPHGDREARRRLAEGCVRR